MGDALQLPDEAVVKSLLIPGDILLFDRPGFFGALIKFKRGERYTHTEVYIGNGDTVASRDGKGVARYPLDLHGVAAVYRIKDGITFDLEKGLEWFKTVDGQGYDWVGLLSFAWARFQGRDNHKMFCSEFVMRFMRACGVYLFAVTTDSDAVSPGLLTYSPRLKAVWLRKDKQTQHED